MLGDRNFMDEAIKGSDLINNNAVALSPQKGQPKKSKYEQERKNSKQKNKKELMLEKIDGKF